MAEILFLIPLIVLLPGIIVFGVVTLAMLATCLLATILSVGVVFDNLIYWVNGKRPIESWLERKSTMEYK